MRVDSGHCRHGYLLLPVVLLLAGCGTTIKNGATEQLLASDAVDRTVSQIDFRDLSGEKVFFDTQYVKAIQGIGFVNADYIVSSLRQQMVAANCLLQDKKEEADFIVEARVGALGTEGHEVTYGLSSNNALNAAASLVPAVPALPPFPEVSFAKKHQQSGAAKIAVFAYHAKTKEPVWQSGIAKSTSITKDTWVLGAGPYQRGAIYDGPHFAGSKLRIPFFGRKPEEENHELVNYEEEVHFQDPPPDEPQPQDDAEEPPNPPRKLRDRIRLLFGQSIDSKTECSAPETPECCVSEQPQ